MPSIYSPPHPYHVANRQRHRQPPDTFHSHSQQLGASPSYPIVIPPSPPQDTINDSTTNDSWNPPSDPSFVYEPFAWPSLWFDVPSISPPGSSSLLIPQSFDMSESLPDLIHSDTKTPEASPVASLRDACTTPAQESNNVVAICDVPLVAPRPLPFTPPAFLEFDCLPEEDEDLSFPPYTHSRRHFCDPQQKRRQNPRKRPAPPPNTPSNNNHDGAEIGAETADTLASLPCISKKRRRLTHAGNAAPPVSFVPSQPASFVTNNNGVPYFNSNFTLGVNG